MKVASDVLGDLKSVYVDKGIIKKLDNHEPLEDLDALKLIGGVFSAGYMAKRKHLKLADPFNDFYGYQVKEKQNSSFSKLTDTKLADALNECYAKDISLKKDVWEDNEFRELLLESAKRWSKRAKNKKVELEFIEL